MSDGKLISLFCDHHSLLMRREKGGISSRREHVLWPIHHRLLSHRTTPWSIPARHRAHLHRVHSTSHGHHGVQRGHACLRGLVDRHILLLLVINDWPTTINDVSELDGCFSLTSSALLPLLFGLFFTLIVHYLPLPRRRR